MTTTPLERTAMAGPLVATQDFAGLAAASRQASRGRGSGALAHAATRLRLREKREVALVGAPGIEPGTSGLKGRCSTS
jgi:hypothetical protein